MYFFLWFRTPIKDKTGWQGYYIKLSFTTNLIFFKPVSYWNSLREGQKKKKKNYDLIDCNDFFMIMCENYMNIKFVGFFTGYIEKSTQLID
jgi:hypothetical protein